ncbi:hypothetical protein KT71_02262 [Congregibacter litoralis KT71]|uniref:Uncharacterized protein n=1 Tax=Congregibacter litoralis KT71 TaxID=314285 RepID=A4A6W4_9GAMM|nr:hypothetical protein KT71_02262 [Congregibacter litoralis KT71]
MPGKVVPVETMPRQYVPGQGPHSLGGGLCHGRQIRVPEPALADETGFNFLADCAHVGTALKLGFELSHDCAHGLHS